MAPRPTKTQLLAAGSTKKKDPDKRNILSGHKLNCLIPPILAPKVEGKNENNWSSERREYDKGLGTPHGPG